MTEVAITPEAVLKQEGVSLTDVLRAALRPGGIAPVRPTPLPKSVEVTAEIAQILKSVAGTLEGVSLLDVRRAMTDDELETNTLALDDVNRAQLALKRAEDKIKQIFQTHFDAVARTKENFPAANDLDYNKDGFYVLEDKESASLPHLDKKAIRTVVSGSPVMTEEALGELESEGVITHAEYLKATQPIRVVDEDGVMELAKDRPEILPDLAAASTQEKADFTQIKLVRND